MSVHGSSEGVAAGCSVLGVATLGAEAGSVDVVLLGVTPASAGTRCGLWTGGLVPSKQARVVALATSASSKARKARTIDGSRSRQAGCVGAFVQSSSRRESLKRRER